jgi:hypothetical protein
MKKYYKTKEEMIGDTKGLRKEALTELYDLRTVKRKELAIKIIRWSSIIIILIIIFKLFIGTISITYILHRNRLYSVTVNDVNVTLDSLETKTIHIIPFMLNLKLYSKKMFYGDDFSSVIHIKQGDPCIIDVKSYKCFVKMNDAKVQSGCDSGIDTINELTTDTHFNLLISETTTNGSVVYNGKFINNISSYLTKKEQYYIEITGKYQNTIGRLVFWIDME